MVKLGINVEAVPIDGMANNRETIAGQVFAGMIDRYVAKQKKSGIGLRYQLALQTAHARPGLSNSTN